MASIAGCSAKGAYPISGLSWVVLHKEQKDPAKGLALAQVLWWLTHDGQAFFQEIAGHVVELLHAEGAVIPVGRAVFAHGVVGGEFDGAPVVARTGVAHARVSMTARRGHHPAADRPE